MPPGLPAFAEQSNFYFTELHWLVVNAFSIVLFCGIAALVARRVWPPWVLVVLATHLAVHALLHLGASLYAWDWSPGAATGLAISLPLAAWTLRWARHTLDHTTLVRALIIGGLTIQGLWDVLARLLFGLRWYAT